MVDTNEVYLVDNAVRNEYVVSSEKIKKVNYKKNLYRAIDFDIKPSWDYLNEYNFYIQDQTIMTYNSDKLKDVFENGLRQGIDFSDVNITTREKIYEIQDDQVYTKHLLDFKVQCSGLFNLLLNQLLAFRIKVEGDDKRELKKNIEHNFKLSNRPGLKNWVPNKSYLKFDMVLYNGVSYRAKNDSNSSEFLAQDWDELGVHKYYSFANSISFFETEHGKKCWGIIKHSMPYIIDKHLGDVVSLKLVNCPCPALNDWFEYDSKTFRITKIIENKGHYDFIELFGCELMKYKSENLPDILSDWQARGWPEVKFNIINSLDNPSTGVAGVEIIVPDYAEHDSECIFDCVLGE